jgi:AcrR family transcriptional regulator
MVEAVARHGFAATTVHELVGLAGVSKSTFYDHFESKEACFLAALDAAVAETARRLAAAAAVPGGLRERMRAGLAAFFELVVAEPAVASLAAVESLTLGSAGVAHREAASEIFEAVAREGFRDSSEGGAVSETTVRAIVNGIAGIVYRRLRAGRTEELPGMVEELVGWALSYRQADSAAVGRAMAAAREPVPDKTVADPRGRPAWEEPADSPASRETLTQRERIVRGAAQVVVARGYGALSIPAISAAAGTSNQTFYEHFSSKRDAFLAAFEAIAAEALGRALGAFEGEEDGARAVGAGLRALAEHIAAHRIFARLAFLELPAAGPVALDRADRIMDEVSAFLGPRLAPGATGGPAAEARLEAIATGIWAVIQREVANERADSLGALAPELARIALVPLQ